MVSSLPPEYPCAATPPRQFVAALVAIAAATPAQAVDADLDGFHATGVWPADCNDSSPSVHPNMLETTGDGVDADCDGQDTLNRFLMERNFQFGWSTTGWVNALPDKVTIGNGSTQGGSISRSYGINVIRGGMAVALGISSNASSGANDCTLKVTTTPIPGPGPSSTSITLLSAMGTGEQVTAQLPFASPPRTLSRVGVECDAGASVTLDWFSVQNSLEIVPPAREATVTWTDLGMPGGGLAAGLIRADADHVLWAGSDVGGVARRETYHFMAPPSPS